MKEKNKQESVRITECAVFEFAILQSAHNVAMALCAVGYFVNIRNISGTYTVFVYKRN